MSRDKLTNIEIKDIRMCDFCNEFDAPYLWVFQSQIIPKGTPEEFLEMLINHPEWFACKTCHELILQKNLTALLDRVIEEERKRGNGEFIAKRRSWFAEMYASLLENLNRN